jgi:hypothetical protein
MTMEVGVQGFSARDRDGGTQGCARTKERESVYIGVLRYPQDGYGIICLCISQHPGRDGIIQIRKAEARDYSIRVVM